MQSFDLGSSPRARTPTFLAESQSYKTSLGLQLSEYNSVHQTQCKSRTSMDSRP
uniref:Uncharacterized protein n=1 Tax=Physcomitrium patens TaxID=3218 RepID=A0A2K1L8L3_PHYPA|nr:hypothetical protein PHYPA_000812 [Physcomitrium patens]